MCEIFGIDSDSCHGVCVCYYLFDIRTNYKFYIFIRNVGGENKRIYSSCKLHIFPLKFKNSVLCLIHCLTVMQNSVCTHANDYTDRLRLYECPLDI